MCNCYINKVVVGKTAQVSTVSFLIFKTLMNIMETQMIKLM